MGSAGKANSLAMGRPRKVGKQTFAIDEESVRHVEPLKAFRRVFLMLCDYMPAVNEDDELLLRLPRRLLSGEGKVLDVKHLKVEGGHKTAIAVHLKKPKGEGADEPQTSELREGHEVNEEEEMSDG